jgi:phosphoglycolate phosphatase
MSGDCFPGLIIVAPHFRPRPRLSHVLMDWDGTISLLRGGWVDVMVDVCIEHAAGYSREQLRAEMLALNGKPSIHQMTRLAELACRGSADEFQQRYTDRLTTVVAGRVSGLRGSCDASAYLVPGVGNLLGVMMARGLELAVATGTPLPELIEEAELLRVAHFFGDRLHGPRDTADREFTKRAAMQSVINDHGIDGEQFAAIGDGPIEITEAKAMGGLAVAVASDEAAPGSRGFDQFKCRQLLECGADLVVPDFLEGTALVKALLGELPVG